MNKNWSPLQKARANYQPKLPQALRGGKLKVEFGKPTTSVGNPEEIKKLFPNTFGSPEVKFQAGTETLPTDPITVGVVLSGGQAPGGHNVIAGLFDALKAANSKNKLLGFLHGPIGVIKGDYIEISQEIINSYRNTGGFDMIQSGRDKIEKPEDLEACKQNAKKMGLNALIIIGGDDSNTNAAVLAEYMKAEKTGVQVIGVPKTIDGDLKNEHIETSFGFDTASKVYSEVICNICRDAMSACKYWHFIRLMGRAASHVTLEAALQTHPNITIVSEEVAANKTNLQEIVDAVADVVVRRAKAGKNYGVLLVPEGLFEFVPDIKAMIAELSTILGQNEEKIQSLASVSEKIVFVTGLLTKDSAKVYSSFPEAIREVLLRRDSHGNVPLSQIETEKLLIDLVAKKLKDLKECGEYSGKFSPLNHFFGYEGRCSAPSNFDADYCYSLGYTSAQLVRAGLTGYTATVMNMTKSSDEWIAGGVPVTKMLTMEIRKGKEKPVIQKALVDLDGAPYQELVSNREAWAVGDEYRFPGPIQYFGPSEVCDQSTITLQLEHKG